MPTFRMRDGNKIYARILGKSGPPLILLHGFGMQSLHWLPFALPLSMNYRVIIPDLRGFGRSHLTSHNQDCIVSNYIEDVNDLADQLALDSFYLAGISMGALTGMKYLSRHAERVIHYSHIDQAPRCLNDDSWTWGLFGQHNQPRLERMYALLEALTPYAQNKTSFDSVPKHLQEQLRYEMGEFFAAALSKPIQKKAAKFICDIPFLASRVMPTQNWPSYLHCLKAYIEQDYNLLPDLADIQTPVSLIVGMKSEMYPSDGQLNIAEHLPNCRVIKFHHSGHAPLLDQPLKLLRELKKAWHYSNA